MIRFARRSLNPSEPHGSRASRWMGFDPILLLLGVLTTLAFSGPATAIGAGSGGGSGLGSLSILCEGDCGGLAGLPRTSDALGQEIEFDFELGIRTESGGFDLSLSSEGNIFLLGPVRGTEAVHLFGAAGIGIQGNVEIVADELRLDGGVSVPGLPKLDPRIPGVPSYNPICGCITLVDAGLELVSGSGSGSGQGGDVRIEIAADGDIRLVRAGQVSNVEAVRGREATPQSTGLTISRSGDLFVDLSGVTLNRLKVRAGQAVVLAGVDSMPVPEPGTALLLGLGLAGLAFRRSSRG